jgi:hypothetical protein
MALTYLFSHMGEDMVARLTEKEFLTESEVSNFPTLADLEACIGMHDPEKWGICQKKEKIEFREPGDGWELRGSLDDIYKEAERKFRKGYHSEGIRLCYGFAQQNGTMHWFTLKEGANSQEFRSCYKTHYTGEYYGAN